MKDRAITGISYTDRSVYDIPEVSNEQKYTHYMLGRETCLPFSHVGCEEQCTTRYNTRKSQRTSGVPHAIARNGETSIEGARYFFIFVDDPIRIVFVYFFKAKSEL